MSGKSTKRRQRRVNTTEEDPEKKPEETIEVSDDSKSNISTDTEKTDKDTSLKDKDESKDDKKETIEKTVENGQAEETNGASENGTTQEESSDIEPLVLDGEDPELQFPSETGSENSEIEKSPILNRCKTRRSQTRNLPTPKTPKALDYNGEEEKNKELRVNVTRLQPTPETAEEEVVPETVETVETEIPEIIDNSENIDYPENIENESQNSSFNEKVQDTDLSNASIFVNLGDTTRNIDITVDETGLNSSNFTKKSYGETLRCLTGRKTLRTQYPSSYTSRMYHSNLELTSRDSPDTSEKYSPFRTGLKRKLDEDIPIEIKKQKTEPSAGLFSYISSPFKTKVGRTDIPSSTPKLTGFKFHEGFSQIDEVKKVDLDFDEKKVEPKKWCSIM